MISFFKKNRFVIGLYLWMMAGCNQIQPQLDKIPPLPSQDAQSINQKISYLTKVIAENPPQADYYFRRGRFYVETERDQQAFDDVQRAISLDSTKAEYFYYLAKIHELQEEVPQALQAAESAQQKGFQSASLYRMLGKLYHQEGNDSLASLNFLRLQESLPQDAEAFYYQGLLFFTKNDTTQAVSSFKNAIGQQANYKEPYLQLIKLYRNYGAYPQARKYSQMALTEVGKDDELYIEDGRLLELSRKYDSALIQYEAALELNTQNWQAKHQIGWIYFQKKNYSEAQKYLEQVLTLQPKHRASNYLMGFIFEYHRTDFPQAKSYYESALAVAPDNPNLKRALRRIAFKMNQ